MIGTWPSGGGAPARGRERRHTAPAGPESKGDLAGPSRADAPAGVARLRGAAGNQAVSRNAPALPRPAGSGKSRRPNRRPRRRAGSAWWGGRHLRAGRAAGRGGDRCTARRRRRQGAGGGGDQQVVIGENVDGGPGQATAETGPQRPPVEMPTQRGRAQGGRRRAAAAGRFRQGGGGTFLRSNSDSGRSGSSPRILVARRPSEHATDGAARGCGRRAWMTWQSVASMTASRSTVPPRPGGQLVGPTLLRLILIKIARSASIRRQARCSRTGSAALDTSRPR